MKRNRLSSTIPVLFLAIAATAASARPALAESPEMTEVYGRAVHEYFAGQLSEAENQLSQVIDA